MENKFDFDTTRPTLTTIAPAIEEGGYTAIYKDDTSPYLGGVFTLNEKTGIAAGFDKNNPEKIAVTFSPRANADEDEVQVVFLTPADIAALLILVDMSPMIAMLADAQKFAEPSGDAATDA